MKTYFLAASMFILGAIIGYQKSEIEQAKTMFKIFTKDLKRERESYQSYSRFHPEYKPYTKTKDGKNVSYYS